VPTTQPPSSPRSRTTTSVSPVLPRPQTRPRGRTTDGLTGLPSLRRRGSLSPGSTLGLSEDSITSSMESFKLRSTSFNKNATGKDLVSNCVASIADDGRDLRTFWKRNNILLKCWRTS
jgi:hypothetical protein